VSRCMCPLEPVKEESGRHIAPGFPCVRGRASFSVAVYPSLKLSTDILKTFCFCCAVRDRVRSKMERDILAEVNHPFIVKLHYGKCSRCDIVEDLR